MGSLNPDAESKQELDDSGYVQDDTASKLAAEESKGPELLDLSDDVLLYIMRYCSPQDLKAVGFTCARLGALVLDRTLWMDVDAGGTRHGRRRVRWLLAQALGPHTRRLRLAGYAKEAEGCLGFVNRYDLSESNNAGAPGYSAEEERYLCGGPRVYRLTQTLPRYGGGFPYWPHAGAGPALPPQPPPAACSQAPPAADGCPGPQLTLTHTGLRELTALCTALRTLELEDCVIDCHTINIGMFPKTLTKLSLKGTKCFNLESKSFLFKIQDHLTHLEELDVSYCTWIEPACMLPLSKMPCLRKLIMRECPKLAEFVAYASLATRYGFKKLKYLDLRGSPVGDSEVSALGWLPLLEELYLSPSPELPRIKEHAHYSQDLLPAHAELEEWEETEPDYFKSPQISDEQWDRDEENVHENRSRYYNTNSDDPSACILLERMIAEPVAPEEYSQVYHQFLAGHQNNMPLANPEEYREAYRQYMERPNHAHPPAGYSLFIRKPDDARKPHRDEPAPAKRRKNEHPETDTSMETDAGPSTSSAEPGPSTSSTSKEADSKASASSDEPGPSTSSARRTSSDACVTRKRDSDDSSDSDDDSPPSKRACAEPARPPPPPPPHDDKAKKDSRGAKKSSKKGKEAANKKKKQKLPRRVFEITINELNTLELLVPPDMPNNAADEAYYANNEADNANDGADNAKNGADNANNGADNANNEADNVDTGANDDKEGKVTDEAKNVDKEPTNVNNDANNGADNANNDNNIADSDSNEANNVNNGTNNDNDGNNNDNKEANNDNKEANNANKEANNAINGAINDNNGNNNENNAANNANNGANNANNGANNAANGAMNPIGQAILDAVNNIFNNEEVANAASNFVDNAAQAAARTQRIFQFRQYRRPIVIEEFVNACDEPAGARRLPRGVLFSGGNLPGGPVRLDHSALVSDSSIRRFGRAIGENINYIHIGGGGLDTNARPDRSNLRVLSVTGYRRVTDASLTHLATAAPLLRELDVSATAVSAAALASFRAMRPDVHVKCECDPDPETPQAD